MMMSEFIERTGFEPTAEEYAQIEESYYEFSGDKDAFCKDFLKNKGVERLIRGRASKIEELKKELEDMEKKLEAEKKASEKEINSLKEQLDKELDWKPCEGGTTMDQGRYEELATAGGTRVLTEQEAKDLIYNEFGFAPEKIRIINTVHTYEANKYHLMRKSNEYIRKPVYNASDWNYIRFDCAGWQYEMVNCSLQSYES
ncbi:hypothetical protein IMSAGC019_03641 [Lachnospiraceae bacterium]|nr:hypothetical protein IMSAGC019_03641 [Lachnospiraceae bacterium]